MGSIPMIAAELEIYATAAMTVPKSVAKGIVRVGFFTEPAGTVADSTPKKAQRVKVAPCVIRLKPERWGEVTFKDSVMCSLRKKNHPRAPMSRMGMSFKMVRSEEHTSELQS